MSAWLRGLAGERVPEAEEYGISSFAYHTSHPFDAHKLSEFFHTPENFRGVLRSKGVLWVAADHRVAYEWGQAGGVSNLSPWAPWWAAVPHEHREEFGFSPDQSSAGDTRDGDRVQQLVFIAQHLDEAKIRAGLDACLLEAELAQADKSAWVTLDNPFPALRLEESAA